MLRAVVPGPACRGGLLPKGPDLARQRISSRLKARDNQGIWLVGWLVGCQAFGLAAWPVKTLSPKPKSEKLSGPPSALPSESK